MKGPVFLCAMLCLLLVGCGSTVSDVPKVPTPTPTIRALPTTHAALAPTTAAATPTRLPTPTMAPTTAPVATATHPHLGDPISTWNNFYPDTGEDLSTSHQKMMGYQFSVSGVSLSAVVVYDPSQGNKSVAISMRPLSGSFDGTDMAQLAIPVDFLPPDAMGGNQVDGDTGLLWHFHSLALGSQLPASYFLDNNGNTVTQGNCNIFYVYVAGSKSNIDHATLTVGDVYGA